MVKILCALVVIFPALAFGSVFTFESDSKQVEGYVILPSKAPKALILYFHRAIEDREAVTEWAKLLGPQGYAVAGYTATSADNVVEEAKKAVNSLRNQKEIASLPIVVMGASMGTKAASGLFAEQAEIRALILMVPGDAENICQAFSKAKGRPIFLIQADQDQIVGAQSAASIHQCLPKNAKYVLLKNTTHRFPPSQVSTEISNWLKAVDTLHP